MRSSRTVIAISAHYAAWLEDAGIPARVIDELMGHQASSRSHLRGSAIGPRPAHPTPEMAAPGR
jgi:hypothetical protein